MEGCLWTSCTLPGQHHPTLATGPQFLACTCVEVELTLVSRAGSQDPPGGLQKEERGMWKRCTTIPHFSLLAGGGVMGAAGHNAAQVAIEDFRHL